MRWYAGASAVAAAMVLAACADSPNPVAPSLGRRPLPTILDGTDVSAGGIIPDFVAGNISGSGAAVCSYLGGWNGYKVDGNGETDALGVDITITSGTWLAWSADAGVTVTAVVMKGGSGQNIYYYNPPPATGDAELRSPDNAGGNAPAISHYIVCVGTDEPPPPPAALLTVLKFYDADLDGIKGDSEALLEGWNFSLTPDGGSVEQHQTTYADVRDQGDYAAEEADPIQTNWIHTTPTVENFTLPASGYTVSFGNVCLGAGGGRTLGFWSNKNGEAQMKDNASLAPELALLSSKNLRNANGTAFDPATYAAFRTWLLNATATNMAYMLSAQYAAMLLNVEAGFVSPGALIYAPGTGVQNGLGFATVQAVMDAANAALGTDANTTAAGPARTLQEALKNALDKANNNINFLQPDATNCPYTFATN